MREVLINMARLVLWMLLLSFTLAFVIIALFPEKPTTNKVGASPNILPDEIRKYGPSGYTPDNATRKRMIRTQSPKNSSATEWGDLRDIIENYSEDGWDVENALEDLRREQEQVKELIRKYEKRQARRNERKEFWTLEHREL